MEKLYSLFPTGLASRVTSIGTTICVVAFNTAEGCSRDVSEDIAGELLERAFDADDNLSEDTKRFIDRHMNPGEKRPRAPSVRIGPRFDIKRRQGSTRTGDH